MAVMPFHGKGEGGGEMRFVDWTHDFHTCCMQTAVMNREEKPIYAYTYIQMYVYIHVYVCIYTHA